MMRVMSFEEINTTANVIIAIFTVIGSLISGLVLFILIWEHVNKFFLRKKIQTFYENIENLIYTYYEFDYHNTIFHKNMKMEGGSRVYNKDDIDAEIIKNNLHFENEFYKRIVKNEFDDYKKYLGMIFTDIFYLNKLNIKIDIRGTLHYKNEYLHNLDTIDDEKIQLIRKFLKGLRDHWNKNYSVFLIRRKVKEKKDFTKLTAYLK